jgi:hypothetical protein
MKINIKEKRRGNYLIYIPVFRTDNLSGRLTMT